MELKKEYINDTYHKSSKAYELCEKLYKNEKNEDIKKWLVIIKKILYWNLWHKIWLFEQFFEEYIEKEYEKKWINFNEDDLNPIEEKFLTKKFVKEELEEIINKIVLLNKNKNLNNVAKYIINWFKALDKYRNKTITLNWKEYTLWDVTVDTLLVDMNRFWAEDRNKFIAKHNLTKLLKDITKDK